MSRQEDFKRMAYDNDREASPEKQQFYFDGAEDGYQYAVEKACEWLCDHLGAPVGMPQAKSYNEAIAELCSEFRKGMED